MTERNIKEMFKMMDTCVSAVENLRTSMDLGMEKLRTDMESGMERLKTDMATGFEDVRSDLAVLKGEVGVLKSDLAGVKSDVAQLKTDVGELKEGQLRLELGLGKNNRLVDRLAGEMMRVDIRVGRLEDATV